MEENQESFKVPIIGPKRPENIESEKPSESQEEFLCPYKVPKYSGSLPDKKYSFEVLKNGVIVEEIKNLHEKPFHVFGRLVVPKVDINSAHPTSSRFHCVLQYRPSVVDESNEQIEEGWFVYDLDSTHGTYLNKYRIKPRTYVRMRVGHQLKLGNSTRCYILTGPCEDEEEQSEFSITELKQQKIEKEAERKQKELEDQLERERLEKEKEEEGINWGMQDDAEDEPDLSENPFAVTNNEELFIDDPKKTLRGFFEREGHDLDYRCDELSPGVFICRIELPIDDEFGKPLICEVQHKGKKKECVVQCALEACRILDRHGVLRQANHEPRRKRKVSESESDDDNFFDRTGDVEKKKMKKQAQPESKSLTYDELTTQEKEILLKIQQCEAKLSEMIEIEKRQKQQSQMEVDDIDSFILNLSDQKIDKFEIRNLKNELQNLKLEHAKIQKLINIAKPSVVLPTIGQSKGKLPLFGKRNRLPRDFGIKKAAETGTVKKDYKEFEVEEDEDDIKENDVVVSEGTAKNVIEKNRNDKMLSKREENDEKLGLSPDQAVSGGKPDKTGQKLPKNEEKQTNKPESTTIPNEKPKIAQHPSHSLETAQNLKHNLESSNASNKISEIAQSSDQNLGTSQKSCKNLQTFIKSPEKQQNQTTKLQTTQLVSVENENTPVSSSLQESSIKLTTNPESIKISATNPEKPSAPSNPGPIKSENTTSDTPNQSTPNPDTTTKKSKKTPRTNRYRPNIDINDDDEYIDEEKVSMWLPPTNQTGDGSSHLNDKFGY